MEADLYGLWIIILGVQNFLLIFSFGMQDTLQKYVSHLIDIGDQQSLLSFYIFCAVFLTAMAFFCTILLNFFALPLSTNLSGEFPLHQQNLTTALRILSIGTFPLLLNLFSKGVLLGLIKNEAARLMDFSEKTLLWIGAVILGKNIADIEILAQWWVIVEFIILIGYSIWFYVFTIKRMRFQELKFTLPPQNERREIIRFSSYSWLSSLGVSLFQSIDKVIVGLVLNPSTAGIYGTATSLAIRITMISTEFAQVITPAVSKIDLKAELSKLQDIFHYLSQILSLLISSATLLSVVWIEEILSIWISPEFAADNALAFKILFIAYGLFTLANPAHRFLLGIGKIKVPAFTFLGASTLTLLIIYISGNVWGLVGAATANMAYSIILIMHFILLKQLSLPGMKTLWQDWNISIVLYLLAIMNIWANTTVVKIGLTVIAFLAVLVRLWKIRKYAKSLGFDS